MSDPQYFVGFDLGDGESAIAWVPRDGGAPIQLYTRPPDGTSVITATARTAAEEDVFGEAALDQPETLHVRMNFKARPKRSRAGMIPNSPVASFASLFLTEFTDEHPEVGRKCIVCIGHPAGWDAETVDVYKAQLQAALPSMNIALVPESQSVFLHLYDEAGFNTHVRPALVVDIGSSTVDFTLVTDDDVAANLPFGDSLGVALIDDAIAGYVRARITPQDEAILAQAPSLAAKLRWLSRRHKEAVFDDRPSWPPTVKTHKDLQWLIDRCWLTLTQVPVMDLVEGAGGWRERFQAELEQVRSHLGSRTPAMVLITGGGARMPFVADVCQEVFPDAVIDPVTEPSLAVARGLASHGRWKARVKTFQSGVRALADSETISEAVRQEAPELAKRLYAVLICNAREAVVEPILREVEAGTAPGAAFGTMKDQSRRLIAWLNTPAGRTARDSLLGPLEEAVDKALRPEADRLCEASALPADALSTQLSLPTSLVLEPRGMVLKASQQFSELMNPLAVQMARFRPGRAWVRASFRLAETMLAQPLRELAGSRFDLTAQDREELVAAVRAEVGRQLLERSRPVEKLLT